MLEHLQPLQAEDRDVRALQPLQPEDGYVGARRPKGRSAAKKKQVEKKDTKVEKKHKEGSRG